MLRHLLILSFLLVSCGSRKVNKSEITHEVKTESKEVVKNDIDSTINIKTETKVFVDETNKEEIEETVFIPIDNYKPSIFGKDTITNGKLVKRKIKRNKELILSEQTNTSNDIKKTDKTEKQSQKTQQAKKSVKTKVVNRKQFDPLAFVISYWWLWLIILIILYLIRKYKNNLLL